MLIGLVRACFALPMMCHGGTAGPGADVPTCGVWRGRISRALQQCAAAVHGCLRVLTLSGLAPLREMRREALLVSRDGSILPSFDRSLFLASLTRPPLRRPHKAPECLTSRASTASVSTCPPQPHMLTARSPSHAPRERGRQWPLRRLGPVHAHVWAEAVEPDRQRGGSRDRQADGAGGPLVWPNLAPLRSPPSPTKKSP